MRRHYPKHLLLPQSLSGDIHGYVGGPGGLPAIGATVVAAEQQTGYTVNSIVSIDGKYFFHLTTRKIYCDGGLS